MLQSPLQLTRRLEAATGILVAAFFVPQARKERLLDIQWAIVLAALIVGFTVGMTGMGGGALMTPILLIFFSVAPTNAVSSDLVAAMFMKPVGGGVHLRRKTVHWDLVKWLCIGSIPTAFGAVFVLNAMGNNETVQNVTKVLLGITLMIAATAMIVKGYLQQRRLAAQGPDAKKDATRHRINVRPFSTLLVGMIGGTLVGLTSVGSGSIIIVCMMLLYPQLSGSELVGTDLVQAVPLVTAAALAHIIIGDFVLGLTGTILIGSLPGVYLGAKLSSKAPDGIIRPALVFVLVASGLKLLNVNTYLLGGLMLAFALVALPVWGAIDAAGRPEHQFHAVGLRKRLWVAVQALGAFFIIGFAAAIAYFARQRPKLEQERLRTLGAQAIPVGDE